MAELEKEKIEYAFILDLWKYIRRHRENNDNAWIDGDELLKTHPDVSFAPEMLKAYIDTLK